jgi:stage II sporulation protein D
VGGKEIKNQKLKCNRIKKRCLTPLILILVLLFSGCKKKYEPVEPVPDVNISSRFWVRVLLFDNIRECSLTAVSDLVVSDGSEKNICGFAATSKAIKVSLKAGSIVIDGVPIGKTAVIKTHETLIFAINKDRYRGHLKLMVSEDNGSFDAINLVPMEAYLYGVVGAEMPGYWETEALMAQATAARTYCLYVKETRGAKRQWDMKTTAAHQVYRGLKAETATVRDAVNKTKGMFLTSDDSKNKDGIFPAYYGSSCGGHTENSKNVFGDSYKTLVGVKCKYCRKVAKKKFFFWPKVEFTTEAISGKLTERYKVLKQKLGSIESIKVSQQSKYRGFARVTSVELVSSSGKKEYLRGEDFRLALDRTGNKLKSACFRIKKSRGKYRFLDGRGFGHGVGMCQCGAEGMARAGAKTDKILSYYYPGSKIKKLY